MNYQLLKQLIGYLADYESQYITSQEEGMEGFVGFLNQQVLGKTKEVSIGFENGESAESLLSKLIAFLYRYAKGYIKKALEQSALITIDDFGYLAGIWRLDGCSKTEIIALNIHEKTTGTEVIKRLLKNEFIEQTNALTDKRSKRLLITEKGKIALFSTFGEMQKASLIIAGNLTDTEKMQLVYLLQKLHVFHNSLFLKEHEKGLDELLNSMQKS